MSEDALRRLSELALVGICSVWGLRRLPAAGWRAGLLMGSFLCAGYIFQTLGLEKTTASNTGFITGLFGWLLADDRLSATGWLGAALIMAAIVAVEVTPRFRPPRPLPEG